MVWWKLACEPSYNANINATFYFSSTASEKFNMKTNTIICLSCLMALALVNTANAAIDAVSLAVIVVAGIAIAKEKLIAAEIHRNYIRRPLESGYEAPQPEYGAPSRSLKRGWGQF